MRVRQVVVAAPELEAAVSELRAELPLGAPYADPGVALFGLRNAVMPMGDTFVEVVAPAQEGTAVGRFLERSGPGAYMVLLQVPDLAAARAAAAAAGAREVWGVELDDIAAVHLHPREFGVVVSLDEPRPAESWRWGGPWQPYGAGSVAGVDVVAPAEAAERWRALGVDASVGPPAVAFRVSVPGRSGSVVACGARFVFERPH